MTFNRITGGISLDAYSNASPQDGQIWFDGVDFNLQAPTLGGLDLSTGILRNSALNGSIYIIPSGTGYISAQVPDNTAIGGNLRGNNAIDLQKVRGIASQVASGNYSIILGGSYHAASGTESAALGGYGNTASANQSVVLGGNTNTSSGDQAIVLGGINNIASGLRSAALGGDNNTASADYSAILGGRLNNVNVSGAQSTILGGRYNAIYTNASVSMGQGSLTEAAYDFVIGNDASATSSSLNSNHFRLAGDTSDIHFGRYADQSAVAGASNKLFFHTTEASNQSKYVSLQAPVSGLTSYSLSLPIAQAPGDGYALTNDGSGNLYWGNPVPNLLVEIDTIEGSIGSAIDGTGAWLGFSGTNLLDTSLTISDALEILDDGYQSLKTKLDLQSVNVVTINSNTSLLTGRTYLVDTTASRTLTLPAPILNGYIALKDKSGLSATNNITLNPFGGLIDGTASAALAKNYGAWALVSDGSDWYFTVSSTAIYGA